MTNTADDWLKEQSDKFAREKRARDDAKFQASINPSNFGSTYEMTMNNHGFKLSKDAESFLRIFEELNAPKPWASEKEKEEYRNKKYDYEQSLKTGLYLEDK